MKGEPITGKKFSLFDFVIELQKIQKLEYYNIDNNLVLQKIIDALFDKTKKYMYLQIFIYMFYFIPHLMQLFYLGDHDIDENYNFILVCNIISSFVLFLFFLQELV
tara:strand:+ start:610 stop:927 length:318 start_codon:yes stop_codon:yes gene_type:complete